MYKTSEYIKNSWLLPSLIASLTNFFQISKFSNHLHHRELILKRKYDECNTCQEHKASQATPHTDVSGADIFSHFHPGQRLQVDYCEKRNQNYLMIVDYVSGYMQAFKTTRKSTEDAIKCIRSWGSKFGLPYEVKSDNGPAFHQEWETDSIPPRMGNWIEQTRNQGPPQLGIQ